MSWKNLNKTKPPFKTWVRIAHIIGGVGAPEREGWSSIGLMKENGRFVIKQNEEKTVDFREPTHWKEIN